MFIAILLSAYEDYDPSKGGFETREDAMEYIKEHLCSSCLEALENGGIYDENGERVLGVWNPLDTPCGAEWCIVEEEELTDMIDSCKKNDRSIPQEYFTRQYEKYKITPEELKKEVTFKEDVNE